MKNYKYHPKPLFEQRMKKLLEEKEDYEKFSEIIHKKPLNYIRANTIKISPEELKERLEKKWEIEQLFPEHPEIVLVKSQLLPGEIGKSEEHLLGYYYVQELSSMMPILALQPNPNEVILDLCASPGSKTTQITAKMNNTGTIIANDKDIGRISILNANLERIGMPGDILSKKLEKLNFKFDKILVDAPCSGEGNLRSNPETFIMWNINMIKKLSGLQKKLLCSVIPLLKPQGELIYSTCTHAPEENEEVVDFALNQFPDLELENINLPIKCREGITKWENKIFLNELKKCARIYPQDNNTEGFFIAKMRKN